MFPGPGDGTFPAVFCWLCKDLVVNFERKIILRLKRVDGLRTVSISERYCTVRKGKKGPGLTAFMGGNCATLGSVKTPTLRAFIFFRSIPTSAVTPSPNRKLEAATYKDIYLATLMIRAETCLERILFLCGRYRSCQHSELVECIDLVVSMNKPMTMAGTGRMLRRVYETKDGMTRSWRHSLR